MSEKSWTLRLSTEARTYPHPTSGYYYDCTITHRILVMVNEISHGSYLILNTHVHEAYDAGMRQSANEYQFSKVLVFRDYCTSFLSRHRHQIFVRGARVYING